MNKIWNLEGVKNSSNTKTLKRVFKLEVSIRNLEAINVTLNSFGYLLIPILQKILLYDLYLKFNRLKDEDETDISKFITFLKREVECRENTVLVSGENKTFSNNKKFVNKNAIETLPQQVHLTWLSVT